MKMSKQTSIGPTVGFGLLLAGLLVLFNPCVHMHDVLPDALGFALVYLALSRVSDVDAYFEDARRIAGFLVLLCTVKHLVALSLLRTSDSSLSLPFTFIASVLELIFVLPFFKKLFHGFEYTAMRTDADEVVRKTADTRRFCVIFVILQSVLNLDPQLLVFIKQQEEIYFKANSTYALPTSVVYNYVLAFSLVAELILGVIYIVVLAGFFRTVRQNIPYRAALFARSEDARHVDETRFASRTLGASLILASLAAISLLDIIIDGIDYVPAMLAAVFGLASLYVFTARGRKYAASPVYVIALIPSVCETLYQLYTGKTCDYLLHGEAARLTYDKSFAFINGAASLPLLAAILILGGIALFFLIRAVICRFQSVCKDTLLGNHDRALLRSAIFFGVTYLLKSAAAVFRLLESRAAAAPDVADYIGTRARMTALAMEQAKAENAALAHFETLESAAFYLTIAAAFAIIFTVFSLLALKGAISKEKE